MPSNCVAITAGKGGVLKTSAATHFAGLAAAAGWRVLLVDSDPQGNAMFDLGYRSDGGHALAAALLDGVELKPITEVRPNLDVAAGGPALDVASTNINSDVETWYRLEDTLAPIAHQYDLIVVDSPARELWIRRMILTAAQYVVIPSGIDRASRVGLPDAANTIREVRANSNPDLDVLGVFTGPISASNTRIRQRARERLGELIGDPTLVCDTVIRHAPLVAEQCRERGILTNEYASYASQRRLPPSRFTDAPVPEIDRDPLAISRYASQVAHDWQSLTDELLARYVTARLADGPVFEGLG